MVKFAIFDLDDTLYPCSSGLMEEVGRRIHTWLREHMGLTFEEAVLMRRSYYHRYGTTLGGLIVEHDIDTHDYLTYVHDIPLEDYISPDSALAAVLDALPLRRVVYTNATSDYAWRVLRALGVAERFERVIGIEEVCLRNKPCQDAYEQALVQLGAWGPECIMVEDSVRNLCPAKVLGMTTVLVGSGVDLCVDYVVGSVLDIGQVVDEILRDAG